MFCFHSRAGAIPSGRLPAAMPPPSPAVVARRAGGAKISIAACRIERRWGVLGSSDSKSGSTPRQQGGRFMPKVVSNLWFAEEAREAVEFYVSVIPDSRIGRTTVLPAETPSGPPGSVELIEFTLADQAFLAM